MAALVHSETESTIRSSAASAAVAICTSSGSFIAPDRSASVRSSEPQSWTQPFSCSMRGVNDATSASQRQARASVLSARATSDWLLLPMRSRLATASTDLATRSQSVARPLKEEPITDSARDATPSQLERRAVISSALTSTRSCASRSMLPGRIAKA